jgi:hypothetical protein
VFFFLQYHRKKEFFSSHLAKYMFMKQCRAQDLDLAVEFSRLAGRFYNPLRKEKKDKEQLNDIDIETEEADDNDFN